MRLERHHWLGLAGLLLVILGTFAPAVVSDGHGEITAYGGGRGDGIFAIALAIITVASSFGRHRLLTLIPATLTAALVVFMFFDMRARLAQQEFVPGFGWVFLVLGALCLLAAGLLPRRP